ncbi:ATP-binding cassette domain-containing protein [Alicyclobacillus kakegawensis]|uniref:ATP-binding cassette domain-containing protein n=1 Tax=Alicyclobacillus kakegawensis TaxID=392012 RepID=UPI001FE0320E|nr:ATP-binding cassette domain-containing protein [Alicyclobacillus kakegawensis]
MTHRLDEIPQIGDRISIMRDGVLVETREVKNITKSEIVSMMVGGKLGDVFVKAESNVIPGQVALRVESLTRQHLFKDISFSVRKGEIVGVFGLVGSRRTDVVRSIMGLDPIDSGSIEIWGEPVRRVSPARLVSSGVALVPEERRRQGLALEQSVRFNVSLAAVGQFSRAGLLNLRTENTLVKEVMAKFRVNSSPQIPVKFLSGGNQQKVIIARWTMAGSRLFLIDEPTRGIDVGAKREIYELMEDIAHSGGAVLMVSSDIEEVLGISDRIIVMRHGEIAAEFSRREATGESLMACAFG